MTEEKGVLGLAAIRKNRGISLEQIAETTKIGVRSLDAIERGDFQKLPGGIYSTSYIRQYARAIDYDESALLEFYHRETGAGTASRTGHDDRGAVRGFRPASTIVES